MAKTLNDIITNLTLEDAIEWELTDEKFIHVTDMYLDRNDLPRSMRAVDRIESRMMEILADNHVIETKDGYMLVRHDGSYATDKDGNNLFDTAAEAAQLI